MRTILLIIIGFAFLIFFDTNAERRGEEAKRTAITPIDTVYFKSEVLPILKKNCSPCHFPGGKMYDRMPFDKPATIIGHEAGALKRFKDQKELRLLKNFIEQNKEFRKAEWIQ